MAKKEFIRIRNTLKELLQKREIIPEKIVFFGTYAKGIQKKDSDIDIIIVSANFRHKDIFERVKITTGIHMKLVEKFMKPFDIMYYSDLEWRKGNSLIINSAKTEGIVFN